MTDLSAMTAEQVYEALSPEQKCLLLELLDAKEMYGPWTRGGGINGGAWWTRHARSRASKIDVSVWLSDGRWFAPWRMSKSKTFADAEAAMRAVDAVLFAAGAVLVSPEDLESVKEVQGG